MFYIFSITKTIYEINNCLFFRIKNIQKLVILIIWWGQRCIFECLNIPLNYLKILFFSDLWSGIRNNFLNILFEINDKNIQKLVILIIWWGQRCIFECLNIPLNYLKILYFSGLWSSIRNNFLNILFEINDKNIQKLVILIIWWGQRYIFECLNIPLNYLKIQFFSDLWIRIHNNFLDILFEINDKNIQKLDILTIWWDQWCIFECFNLNHNYLKNLILVICEE